MAHWCEQYVGRPYIEEVSDCADLVCEVVRDLRGISLNLPSDRQWRRTAPEDLIQSYGHLADPTDAPQDGDAILMAIRGRRNQLGSHIGVVGLHEGVVWCLHSLEITGSVFQPLDVLARAHLVVRGFYAWR